MNKAVARHMLLNNAWSAEEVLLAERVLRHDGTRRRDTVLPTLTQFASRQSGAESEAWQRLLDTLREDGRLIDALHALLAL